MKKAFSICIFICFIIFIAGCGKEEIATEKWGYGLTEYILPDPNEGIADVEELEEKIYAICEEQIIRISQTQKLEENRVLFKWYIQTLKEPYESWNTEIIEQTVNWNNERYVIGNCCVNPKGEVHFLIYNSEENVCFLTKWQDGIAIEAQEVLLDTSLFFCNWEMDAQKNSYFYGNDMLRVFDATFQEQNGLEADGELLDLLMTPEGEAYAWYVKDALTGTMRIQAVEDRRELVNEDILRNTLTNYVWTVGENEEIYQASADRGYRLGNEKETLFSYVELGTWVQTVESMQYSAEKGFQILASDGYDRVLLCIKDGMQPIEATKEEIVLVAESNSFLERCIVDFNRRSEDYYITLEAWDSNVEYYADFCSRIQLEISTGGGPDLIEESAILLDSYARGGYLEPLDDLIGEYKTELVEAAVESGKVEGKYYVMPYYFKIDTMMTLKENVQGTEGWTLEQLKSILAEKRTEALYQGARAWDVLYVCIAMDEESKTFVNWEEGKCYFDSEEFVELLHFSQEYADSQSSLVSDIELERMKANELLMKKSYGITSVKSFLNEADALEREGTFIGYPVERGSGTYVEGRGFALNSSSKCKDGAKEFLRYLASEDTQLAMSQYTEMLPVNKKALEWEIEEALAEELLGGEKKFTKEYAVEFWALLEKSKPAGKNYVNIINILYEETGAFYSGDKSAKEVAGLIQNRVQLYLDEIN